MRVFFVALVINFMLIFSEIEEASGLLRRLKAEKSASKEDKNKIESPATSTHMPPRAPKHNPIQADIKKSPQQTPSREIAELLKKFTLSDGQHQGRDYSGRENIDWLIQQRRKMIHSEGHLSTAMIQNDHKLQQEKEYLGRENIDWLIQYTLHKTPSYGSSSTMMIQGDQLQQHDQNDLGYGNIHGSVHNFEQMAHPAHQSSTSTPQQLEQGATYLRMERRLKSEEAKKMKAQMDETGKFRVPPSKKHNRLNEQSHSSDRDPQSQRRKINENAVWREVTSNSHDRLSRLSQHQKYGSQGDETDLIKNDMNAYFNPYHEYQPRDPGSGSQH